MSRGLPLDAGLLILGGGPVGLFLACRLAQLGFPPVVLERRLAPQAHSRAIGIHSPCIELLEELEVVDAFLAHGRKVPGGVAVGHRRMLGRLSFQEIGARYPFALSVPQQWTERLLEARLEGLAPGALRRGWTALSIRPGIEKVTVQAEGPDGRRQDVRCRLLVGCDGKDSLVRKAADIGFAGRPYPDTYVMGDFDDNTDHGDDAYLFLSGRGLVESFPLPGGLRRWVMRVPDYEPHPALDDFCGQVHRRTGHQLAGVANHMLSPFGIQHYRADRLHQGLMVLAGDAAHVVSPIGGQGMNCGWMDAWELADAMATICDGADVDETLESYSHRARRRALRVTRRAEFNTFMGRATQLPTLRSALVWAMLRTPARGAMARMFSMQGLMNDRMAERRNDRMTE